jgi:hypothetical protein
MLENMKNLISPSVDAQVDRLNAKIEARKEAIDG